MTSPEPELPALLDTTLDRVRGDGMAIGVVTGTTTTFATRGVLAGRPVRPESVFYGASITKQVIGFLLATAVQAGKASATDSVRSWLPELPAWLAPVRLDHLLHHIADIPDVTEPAPGRPRSNAEVIDRLVRLSPHPRIHPGTRFAYNNAGYVLLAEVVARISGQAVETLAATTLFDPLRLPATRLGGEPIRLDGPEVPGTVGDGGLWTPVTDLTRWLTALNDGTLDPRVVRQLETPGRLDDGSPLDYAWGVRVTPGPSGRQVSHGGRWDPWLAKTVRVPERRIAVAVVSAGGTEAAVSDAGTQLAAALASESAADHHLT